MPDNTIASLGLRVDSSQVVAATPALDSLAASANKAATAETSLAAASAAASTQIHASVLEAAKYAAAQNSASAAQSQAVALIQQNVAAQRASVVPLQTTNQATQAATLSAKQYAQALRQLPAQLTDITVGLASGQSPFLVLLQQGGQLKDSFGGIGAAVRALLGAISPAILVVGGLGAVGALAAKAFNDGQNEAFEFQKAIILSGNAADVTASQLSGMADEVAKIAGTRGEASAALNAAVSSGQIAGNLLRDIAAAAVELQHAGGDPIDETIKKFASLGDRPLAAAEALNKQAHFLTVELYEQIKALDEQGRTSEAAAVAQKGFLDDSRERAEKLRASLGTLPKLWDDIKTAAAGAWEAVARAPSIDDRIAALQAQLRTGVRGGSSSFAPVEQIDLGANPAEQAAAQRQLDALTVQRDKQRADAARSAQAAQALVLRRQQDDLSDAIDKGGVSDSASALQANLAGIQRALNASEAAYSAYQDAIESQHRAGLISDREYYDTRRKLITDDLAAQTDAIKKENDALSTREAAIRSAADKAAGRATPAKAFEIEADAARQILDLETKRKDNLTEIGVLTGKASVATAQTVSEEETRFKSLSAGYQSARDAAQAYLDTLKRSQDAELAGLGQGDRERQRQSGRLNVADRYDVQRRDLENAKTQSELQGTFNADAKKRYDEQLAIINEFQGKALQSYDDYWTELTKKQGSFFIGAAEAFHNYLDQAQDTAGQVAAALSKGLNGATDSLVKFATTGKGEFKELVNSIIADLLRIQLQKSLSTVLSSALGSVFSGLFGGAGALSGTSGVGTLSGSTVGYAADGGDISGPTIVGERGKELFIPKTPGTVIPNHQLGSFGRQAGPTVSLTYHAAPGSSVATDMSQLQQLADEIEGRIQNNVRRGWGGWPQALSGA